ncbi:hypothetical protein fugu_005223 [Takifugu bimaculatus]|uniref:Protein kinase domain-containing protein n=1 Tax=Takifugu bimaculatus TaxID=433685 RepID=A0A4Z2BAU2_9TELE|nr:hypothetical protein fugu_005223 [Takifugu bimaculatus]
MGSGVYGQVAKCLNKTTKEMVAVKVFCNTGGIHEARWEVRQVVQLLGQPEDHLLCQGIYTRKYFLEEEGGDGPTWRLKTPEEYMSGTHEKIRTDIRNCKYQCLDDLVHVSSSMIYPLRSPADHEDRRQFVDLLKCLLTVNSEKRISSSRALQHPFIMMSHLLDPGYES